MKNVKIIIATIILILGCINTGIFLLGFLFGKFFCGHFFEFINGANGPIPTCGNIFNTFLIFPLLFGLFLILIGTILLITRKNKTLK